MNKSQWIGLGVFLATCAYTLLIVILSRGPAATRTAERILKRDREFKEVE